MNIIKWADLQQEGKKCGKQSFSMIYRFVTYASVFPQDWLDIKQVSSRAALAMIRPIKLLTWHPVSTLVNNSRNKEPQCNKPVTLEYVHTAV
jgi:hypothetical protein